MKIHQLRYIIEIERHQFNISAAAKSLCTAQSGISRQIKLLEEELGVILYARKGKHLLGYTSAGKEISLQAAKVLQQLEGIRHIAGQHNAMRGRLCIATTHTQARYILPYVVHEFSGQFPEIELILQQGTPIDVAERVLSGDADIAIATEALETAKELLALPCYQWSRCIIINKAHPLAKQQKPGLRVLQKYPLITYDHGFTGRHKLDEAFEKLKLKPNIVLTAVDADVIKTYVRLGLGVGIIADMAFNQVADDDLLAIPADDLFGVSTTYLAFKRDCFLRSYIYKFIELCAPHLTEGLVRHAAENAERTDSGLRELQIPRYLLGEGIVPE